MKISPVLSLIPLALLTACAALGRKETDTQQLARYMDYAGAPIERFTYLGRYDSWQPLGRNHVLIRTSINNAYLLSLEPTCFDLPFAQHIAVTSTGRSVTRRFDSVRVHGQRCMITEIRPVDYRQMKEDARRAG